MKDQRRQKLLDLLNGPAFNGDRSAFLSAAKISKGRLSQLEDKTQPFGESAGRNLADRLGLPEHYFEPSTKESKRGDLSPQAYGLGKMFDSLPVGDGILWTQVLHRLHQVIQTAIESTRSTAPPTQGTETQPAELQSQPEQRKT